MQLDGVAALVTGAVSGLGAAMAADLAGRGATVCDLDLDKAVAGASATPDLAQYGIRVMTIAPGIVETPMMAGLSAEVRAGLAATVPFPRRLAQPAEFARLVAMLADLDDLNGEVIGMDGASRMTAR
ncbi:SDR family oxidoreductase [Blastococcus sp. BMG 814]|uniref:SDR family oxidoreductase n=1 Tax=Blastococcus carthaginiensis TaxID=3050034 RepID=A0ABT9I9R9_9ACTN|nr:SDR family oxidoreductase [Blastococcus carthaginiensis]MDP5182315.1 SDR family oxidoreductase [Blastococcus carthaginiensis]